MRRVDKPWGHEIIWAETDRYAGKLLHIAAGHALSLQYHERKAESIYVLSGRLHLHHASAPGEPVSVRVVEAGDAFDIVPGMLHRFEAREPVVLVEVSTPELDDVVRLDDRYGREGTSEA
ncbi:MAG: cupin domain-containing protein [Deltaproteobacteria bacterium]|nr:cupin domain-containing protein [Deltaproteobacteria bacterium]MCB9785956.1 cupin domain-containing protein [Deltaproteobacteria bacterium]